MASIVDPAKFMAGIASRFVILIRVSVRVRIRVIQVWIFSDRETDIQMDI
jgi:hypothetical protein